MLRSFLIYLSKASWAQQMMTKWKFAWKVASRFVAGESVDDAIRVVKELNSKGINATLDQLGEHTTNPQESLKSTNGILDILEQINKNGVRSNVSIKLTQIGLSLDSNLCANNLENILTKAKELGNYVRIDMEDTPFTDRTISLYREMRNKGFSDVGIVLQSCLYRTEADVRGLLDEGARFRLVKGAYKEPADFAFPKKVDVDSNFDLLANMMIDGAVASGSKEINENGRIPPVTALGTHDEKRIISSKKYAEVKGLPKQALEIQMLYGIRRDLQDQLACEGYPIRVYVPFGTQWYPYFMRRLAERPANVWFFVSNFLKK
jgi:proline dehydrogenase